MSSMQINLPPIRYRKKCQILAAIDLLWRVCDLFYATVSIFFPKYGHKTREIPEDEVVLSYDVITVLDARVYDFILSPFLTLIYFMGFFLQVSSSIFLCKSCNGKAIPENERAACRIWSRVALVSLVIFCIRFFLPYVFLSVFYVTYNVVRVLFKVFGIYIVIKHGQEMQVLLLYFDLPEGAGRSRIGSSTASGSQGEEIPIPFDKGTSTRRKQSSFRDVKGNNQSKRHNPKENIQFVRPRVHRAMLLVDKDSFDTALNELRIAQSYAPEDPNVAVLLRAVEKMENIINSQKKDYYKILGVSRTLSRDEIKRAFRRKSLRHHPDKHFTESDKVKTLETKIFQEIHEAYATLSDPKKRAAYDEKSERDQEILQEYKKIFKTTYASFDSQYLSSIV